jgi:hypothetical protein
MRDIHSILEDYGQGDFEKRLSLYLVYRDLRHEFSAIEKKEKSMNIKAFGANGRQKKEKGRSILGWTMFRLRNRTVV